MKTFLSKNKKPICKWSMIPQNVYFEGNIPEGYKLCVNPHWPYCIIDIDNKGIGQNGFEHIPENLKEELNQHFNYDTPSKGKHIWILYSGNKHLMNKTSSLFIDLRTNKGYAVWYPKTDVRLHLHEIKESSKRLNKFLEKLFS